MKSDLTIFLTVSEHTLLLKFTSFNNKHCFNVKKYENPVYLSINSSKIFRTVQYNLDWKDVYKRQVENYLENLV